jgi:hypothetical protein
MSFSVDLHECFILATTSSPSLARLNRIPSRVLYPCKVIFLFVFRPGLTLDILILVDKVPLRTHHLSLVELLFFFSHHPYPTVPLALPLSSFTTLLLSLLVLLQSDLSSPVARVKLAVRAIQQKREHISDGKMIGSLCCFVCWRRGSGSCAAIVSDGRELQDAGGIG